jgi:hypothetical protein
VPPAHLETGEREPQTDHSRDEKARFQRHSGCRGHSQTALAGIMPGACSTASSRCELIVGRSSSFIQDYLWITLSEPASRDPMHCYLSLASGRSSAVNTFFYPTP